MQNYRKLNKKINKILKVCRRKKIYTKTTQNIPKNLTNTQISQKRRVLLQKIMKTEKENTNIAFSNNIYNLLYTRPLFKYLPTVSLEMFKCSDNSKLFLNFNFKFLAFSNLF